MFGIIQLIIAVLIGLFPKHLPKKNRKDVEKVVAGAHVQEEVEWKSKG